MRAYTQEQWITEKRDRKVSVHICKNQVLLCFVMEFEPGRRVSSRASSGTWKVVFVDQANVMNSTATSATAVIVTFARIASRPPLAAEFDVACAFDAASVPVGAPEVTVSMTVTTGGGVVELDVVVDVVDVVVELGVVVVVLLVVVEVVVEEVVVVVVLLLLVVLEKTIVFVRLDVVLCAGVIEDDAAFGLLGVPPEPDDDDDDCPSKASISKGPICEYTSVLSAELTNSRIWVHLCLVSHFRRMKSARKVSRIAKMVRPGKDLMES